MQTLDKMGSVEEDAFKRCHDILKKMKQAVERQRNISKEVKDGIVEMEEAIDAIFHCRNPPRQAEKEDNVMVATETNTPSTTDRSERSIEESPEGEQPWVRVSYRNAKKNSQRSLAHHQEHSTDEMETVHRNNGPYKERRQKKQRLPALLIKPSQGKTYADVLREIRQNANPADTGTEVKSIRRTKAGDVLMEVGNNSKDKAAFVDQLANVLRENATIRNMEPRKSIMIKDLDSLTTPEEVTEAIKNFLSDSVEELRVVVTKPNRSEQRMAIVTLTERAANELLMREHIKVGLVSCRVKERFTVSRCYRCLNYGHIAKSCKGPDRSKSCFKCGQMEHKAKDCTAPKKCVLCEEKNVKEIGHIAGTSQCKVFREALEKTMNRKPQ